MSRSAFSGVRSLSIALGLVIALAPQFLQPHGVGAQPAPVTVSKAVCNASVAPYTGTCPATAAGPSTTASPGNTLQYYVTATNNSGVPATLNISDPLQAGQAFVNCSVTAGTCGYNGTTVSATANNVPSGTSVTLTFRVTVTGSNTTISNTASAYASEGLVCPAGFTPDPTTNGRCTMPATAGTCPPGSVLNGSTCYTTGSCPGAPAYRYDNPNATPGQCTTYPPDPSNATTVTVGAGTPGPGPTCFTSSKAVRDVTLGQNYTTSTQAFPGDLVRYRIVVTNTCGATVTGVSISDMIQPGTNFSSCTPATCTVSGNTVTFAVGDMPASTSATVFIDVVPTPTFVNQTIPNTANITSTNAGSMSTNTTFVMIVTSSTPPPCFTGCAPPPCFTGCFPAPVIFPGFFTAGPVTIVICGTLTAFTAATSGLGFMAVNGMTFPLNPFLVPGGVQFAVGGSFCFIMTFSVFAQVTAFVVQPNVAAVNFVCGNLTPFTPGFSPFPGFAPFPGFTPTGSGFNMVMIGGFPFPVAAGAGFPFSVPFGSTSCFLMSGGFVSGVFAGFPVAATPAEDAAGVHRSGRHLAA